MCPICNRTSQEVKGRAVRNFVLDSLEDKVVEESYGICLNEDCDVIYYDLVGSIIFRKEDMRIPI